MISDVKKIELSSYCKIANCLMIHSATLTKHKSDGWLDTEMTEFHLQHIPHS